MGVDVGRVGERCGGVRMGEGKGKMSEMGERWGEEGRKSGEWREADGGR